MFTWSLRQQVESNKTPRFLGGSILGAMGESPMLINLFTNIYMCHPGSGDQLGFSLSLGSISPDMGNVYNAVELSGQPTPSTLVNMILADGCQEENICVWFLVKSAFKSHICGVAYYWRPCDARICVNYLSQIRGGGGGGGGGGGPARNTFPSSELP